MTIRNGWAETIAGLGARPGQVFKYEDKGRMMHFTVVDADRVMLHDGKSTNRTARRRLRAQSRKAAHG